MLTTMEFTHNNQRHADCQNTPFELMLGIMPVAIPLLLCLQISLGYNQAFLDQSLFGSKFVQTIENSPKSLSLRRANVQ